MIQSATNSYTAFEGYTRIAAGPLPEVALAAKRALMKPAVSPVLIYSDLTGRLVDIDPTLRDEDLVTVCRLRLRRRRSSNPPRPRSHEREAGRSWAWCPGRSRCSRAIGIG